MIARAFLLILLAELLPDIYIYIRYVRGRVPALAAWKLALLAAPCAAVPAAAAVLAAGRNFAPDSLWTLNAFLLLVALYVVPKALFALFALAGSFAGRRGRKAGAVLGGVAAFAAVATTAYGVAAGAGSVEVRRVELAFENLPEEFDGYRVVFFSDLHVGTYGSVHTSMVAACVDSINAQDADLVAFGGDMQNMKPAEVEPFVGVLSGIRAKDGVFSVLGNHDYAEYTDESPEVEAANMARTKSVQADMGWQLLLNSHSVVRRGADSIVVAGTENDGRKPFPSKADMAAAVAGVAPGAFTIMLQHDPSSWRRNILPGTQAALTMSGHTHGGQFDLAGLRFTRFIYGEDYGLYSEGGRFLYVSGGVGSFVPFRVGVKPEIVTITLRRAE